MSWPPASRPFSTSGSRSARAAYRAAVKPAGPEPITITFRTSSAIVGILPYPPTLAYSVALQRRVGRRKHVAAPDRRDEQLHPGRWQTGTRTDGVQAEIGWRAFETRSEDPGERSGRVAERLVQARRRVWEFGGKHVSRLKVGRLRCLPEGDAARRRLGRLDTAERGGHRRQL